MAKQFGLTKNTFFIPKDERIIRAEQYRDLVDAERIIQTATDRAKEIILQAEQEREKCHELGYLDGLKEARELVLKEMIGVYAKAGEYLSDAEETLLQIVVASLKKITGESLDQGVIQNQLQKAIKEELVRGRLKIRLHPEVAEKVGQELYQLANRHPVIDYLEVVKDNSVDRGSCLIESDLGVVDMSIDRQLKALFSVIQQYIPEAEALSHTAEEIISTLHNPSREEVMERMDDSRLLDTKASQDDRVEAVLDDAIDISAADTDQLDEQAENASIEANSFDSMDALTSLDLKEDTTDAPDAVTDVPELTQVDEVPTLNEEVDPIAEVPEALGLKNIDIRQVNENLTYNVEPLESIDEEFQLEFPNRDGQINEHQASMPEGIDKEEQSLTSSVAEIVQNGSVNDTSDLLDVWATDPTPTDEKTKKRK